MYIDLPGHILELGCAVLLLRDWRFMQQPEQAGVPLVQNLQVYKLEQRAWSAYKTQHRLHHLPKETFAVLMLVQSVMPSVLLRQVLASIIMQCILTLPVHCVNNVASFYVLSNIWNGTWFRRRSV